MKRATRADLAKQTVEIIRRGSYRCASGLEVCVAEQVEACLSSTRHFRPDELEQIRDDVLGRAPSSRLATIEVVNESTLGGIERFVLDDTDPVAALNFASAKNPGGGFLNGSQAQEESLARSSALHASLLCAPDFYQHHRSSPSLLYSDAMILSPACPIIRDDDGRLLEMPLAATFITSPAPNAGAAADSRRDELPLIPETLNRRAECILALAAYSGHRRLIVGAWGCGAFRNDPQVVAAAFASHMSPGGRWACRFDRVAFSILDSSPSHETLRVFQRALAGA